MNSFSIVFCVVLALSSALPRPENDKKLQESHEECLKKAGIEEADLTKVLESKVSEDVLEEYSYCLGKTYGFIGNDNKIDRDVAKQAFEGMIPGSSEEFLKACISDGEVTKKVALEIQRCIKRVVRGLRKN